MFFRKPDITGWSYDAIVHDDHARLLIRDPDGDYWYKEKSGGAPYCHPRGDLNTSGSYGNVIRWNVPSISEEGIARDAKRVIYRCLKPYNRAKALEAIRAEDHSREF